MPNDRRLLLLRAAFGFLQLPPIEPELVMLHRWLDTWNGIGHVAVGMHRQGLRLSLSHIAEGRVAVRLHGRQSETRTRGLRRGADAMGRGARGGVGGAALTSVGPDDWRRVKADLRLVTGRAYPSR